MTQEWQERLEAAVKIVTAAGDAAEKARAHLTVYHKTDNDYVTQVDRDTERAICTALAALYPEDGFLGEEYGKKGQQDQVWVLDPIDGTTNFIRGIEEYAVSLAYLVKGEPTVGIVYCPALKNLYTAVKGAGARKNGKALHVSQEDALRETVVGMSFAHRLPEYAEGIHRMIARLMVESGDMRRSGSAALDLCRVADGCYGAFVEPGLNIYDIAAGVLIVREAGGTVTAFPGEGDVFSTCNTLASNTLLHPTVEALVRDCFGHKPIFDFLS